MTIVNFAMSDAINGVPQKDARAVLQQSITGTSACSTEQANLHSKYIVEDIKSRSCTVEPEFPKWMVFCLQDCLFHQYLIWLPIRNQPISKPWCKGQINNVCVTKLWLQLVLWKKHTYKPKGAKCGCARNVLWIVLFCDCPITHRLRWLAFLTTSHWLESQCWQQNKIKKTTNYQ